MSKLFGLMCMFAMACAVDTVDQVSQGVGGGSNIPGTEVIEDERDVEILLEQCPLDTWSIPGVIREEDHLVTVGNMRCGCYYWDGSRPATAVCCSSASNQWPRNSSCRGVSACWLGRGTNRY